MKLEFITLSVYLIILMVLGGLFSRLNRDVSDFARGGAQGTWWMVGTSMFMAGISAFTFTGNASAAFEAGPTFLIIYVANCIGLGLCVWIGPWFRQTRATTWADIMRDRFNVGVEQVSVAFSLLLQPVAAATQLYALSVFASAILQVPTAGVIVLLGTIVMVYSTTGGRWAVMATDVVQGIVMFSLTVLLFVLSLKEIGGFGAFFSFFQQPDFASDFAWVKPEGAFPENKFTWKWIVVIFILQLQGYVNLGTAGRFLSVKDGKNARWASVWACALMFVGTIVWFVPPMVGRFLHGAEIMALDVKEPATASYAFMAQHLLPNGMMGFMLAAMLAATMSSMDTGLNSTTGVIVNNLIPWFRTRLNLDPLSSRAELFHCRFSTLLLGTYIIIIALMLSLQQELSLFDAYLMISAVIGLPLGMPVLMALWVRKLHWASYYVIIGFALLPSTYFLYASTVGGESWPIQDRLVWIYLFSLVGCILSLPLWKIASPSYKQKVQAFYERMHLPVDFAKEVGEEHDLFQYVTLGGTTVVMGILVLGVTLLPNPVLGRMAIASVGTSILLIGLILLAIARKKIRKQNQ